MGLNTLWRRFVRWLARDDILQAYDAASGLAHALLAQHMEMQQKIAYAQGELDGRKAFEQAVLQAVHERMGGGLDTVVAEEDVAVAKNRSVH